MSPEGNHARDGGRGCVGWLVGIVIVGALAFWIVGAMQDRHYSDVADRMTGRGKYAVEPGALDREAERRALAYAQRLAGLNAAAAEARLVEWVETYLREGGPMPILTPEQRAESAASWNEEVDQIDGWPAHWRSKPLEERERFAKLWGVDLYTGRAK